MLARSTTIRPPGGISIQTPILVPSFSSKGFKVKQNGISEVKDIFVNTAEFLTETMLVSAYDIFYRHILSPHKFPCVPALTFVDSGGYETNADHDYCTVYHFHNKPRPWELKHLQNILDSWPERIPAVFINFDKSSAGKSLPKQIALARGLFANYPKQMHNFLLKPSWQSKGNLLPIINALPTCITEIADFHILGVTEKELGNTPLDRMVAIATLRRHMDTANIRAPIQVFGALDPLSACLYFLAGAEIFDGLSWLRFSYTDGYCTYMQNYGILHIGLDQNDDYVRAKTFSDNYTFLRDLQLKMRTFATTKDYSALPYHSGFLRQASDALSGRLNGGV
ncbi:MAG: hypothetical protein PHW60_08115 [Kiritimatiellae bacterium]|nr:hypothetical protein [Kiritimatiellia bacterium]